MANLPSSLRNACELSERRKHRVDPGFWLTLRLWIYIVVPVIFFALLSLPKYPSRAAGEDTLGVFSALLGVHATVAGLAVVAFVFLLQTANFSQRRKASMLALAQRAGILQATAISLGTLSGEAVALALGRIFSSNKTVTIPVLLAVVAGLLLTIVLTFRALLKGAAMLGKRELAEVEKQTLLQQVALITTAEMEKNASKMWLLMHPIAPLGHFVDSFSSKTAAMIECPKGKQLYDVKLRELHALAQGLASDSTNVTVKLIHGISWSRTTDVSSFLQIAGPIDKRLQRKFRKCLIWEKRQDLDPSILVDLKDKVVSAIEAGEVGTLQVALDQCKEVIRTVFACLDEYDSSAERGVEEFTAFHAVVSVLRTALDYSIQSGKGDIARKISATLSGSILICARSKNITCVRRLATLFTLVRKLVRQKELINQPLFSDIYWRPLKETLEIVYLESKGEEPEFMVQLTSVVEEVLQDMLQESISEGAHDLGDLLNIWRLTLEDSIISNDALESVDPSVSNWDAHWLALVAWALHLKVIGKANKDMLSNVFGVLEPKLGDASSLAKAAQSAMEFDDEDRLALNNWIYFSQASNEGVVMVGGGRPQLLMAFSVLLLIRSQKSLSGQLTFGSGRHQAADVASQAIDALDTLADPSNSIILSLKDIGILSDPIVPHVEACKKALLDSVEAESELKKEILRNSPISEENVTDFSATVRKEFLQQRFFSCIPEIAKISEEIQPFDPEGKRTVLHQLQPKDYFLTSPTMPWDGLARSYGQGLARGEQRSVLQTIAVGSERQELPPGTLPDTLAKLASDRKKGCIVIRRAVWQEISHHSEFSYRESKEHEGWLLGTLAGLPVFYVFDLTEFDAIYLPENCIVLENSAAESQPDQVITVVVRAVDEVEGKKIVTDWRERSPEKYASDAEFEADALRLQENCIVMVEVRPSAKSEGAIVFVTQTQDK